MQYADRDYDFPRPRARSRTREVANQFAIGVNRGNPDFYKEKRFEIVDNVTKNIGKPHILVRWRLQLGSNDQNRSRCSIRSKPPSYVSTQAMELVQFRTCRTTILWSSSMNRFQGPTFNEATFDPSVFQLSHYPDAVRNGASGLHIDHTYSGLFVQDNWRATQN